MSEVRMIYSLTTDRQPVIYWEINHLLTKICFVSNIQETMKKHAVLASGFKEC